MDYSPAVKRLLSKEKVGIGDRVHIEKGKNSFEGIVMPNTGQPDLLVVKLSNGYNIGLETEDIKIKKLPELKKPLPKKFRHEYDKSKKTILILHTGGTVASKIDYETGAVSASVEPEDLLASMPELAKIANIRTEMVFQMYSGDMEPEHWIELAKKVAQEHERFDGIIITHGTDTIHYTTAALSFMLQNIPKPVIFVGSQRSSDRGSSDAAMNMICAAHFIVGGNFKGIALCMHANMNDDDCYIHSGLHVRKMHTSRRDSFRSIDVLPIARVSKTGNIEALYDFRTKGEYKSLPVFNKKVAIVKIHPGFNYKLLEFFEKAGYKGIVLEGTGLGHAPVDVLDKYTRHHALVLSAIKRLAKNSVVAMTSQCLYGKVNMNVYSYGRKLLEAGVVPVQMTPETAYVKLGWVLGHTKNAEAAKNLMQMNLIGEQVERIDPRAFLF
ncbi:MAG: glutamyl-tRNA(Gln) amidotransferase subunit D [archaeon GW2011_AR5]|nr:MAG: glutamyl-tRNA(Gln) amidotransferase subunit D [archaeon GW2011_AR5]